ncbi:MAG: hypothetical protein KGJ61_06590 [Candidatus Omnitrophica bacterium]|nr:hypothetical protein [Candidatus Omnitrophota bacterium]
MRTPLKPLNCQSLVSLLMTVCFTVSGLGFPPARAEDFKLPVPGVMVQLSPPLVPPLLKGIKVYAKNPFRFDFILDKGEGELSRDELKEESTRLIKYFLTSLTIPEKDLWVNLSPYEKDRIIPQNFSLTEMGRDLLAEDYMLKQITASLIYPEGRVGRKFWKRVYEEAARRYGTTDIPVNTFNKVWIVPQKAVVYENAAAGTAYVVESSLKVMLEEDYLSLREHEGVQSAKASRINSASTSELGSEIIRQIVLPELTREVNEDKNFIRARQIYNSLILATWYKEKIKNSLLTRVYADKNKVAGVNVSDPQEKEKIYKRYLLAFKKGVYNYIKEVQGPMDDEMIPRKYFSGGFDYAMRVDNVPGLNAEGVIETVHNVDAASLAADGKLDVTVNLEVTAPHTGPSGEQATAAEQMLRERRLKSFSEFLSLDGQLKALMVQPLAADRGEFDTEIGPFRNEITRRLSQMQSVIDSMAGDLASQEGVSPEVVNKIKETARALAAQYPQSYQYHFLKQWYDRLVTGMTDAFLEGVNSKIVGWVSLDENFIKVAGTATSFNELLHLMHAYALVNFRITDGLSIWRKTARAGHEGDIIATGEETPVATSIYNELQRVFNILEDPASADHEMYAKRWPGGLPAVVHMFSLPGMTYLMVRDYGHALFIEVKGHEGEKLTVNYKIPKAFSKQEVSHLPDVVYSPKTDTASGQLNLVDAANIGPVLADFIRKVPTDTSRWNPENDKAMAAPLVLDGKTVPQSPLADVLDHLKTKQDFDHQEIWEITDLQNFTGRLNELKQLIDLDYEVGLVYTDQGRWLLFTGNRERIPYDPLLPLFEQGRILLDIHSHPVVLKARSMSGHPGYPSMFDYDAYARYSNNSIILSQEGISFVTRPLKDPNDGEDLRALGYSFNNRYMLWLNARPERRYSPLKTTTFYQASDNEYKDFIKAAGIRLKILSWNSSGVRKRLDDLLRSIKKFNPLSKLRSKELSERLEAQDFLDRRYSSIIPNRRIDWIVGDIEETYARIKQDAQAAGGQNLTLGAFTARYPYRIDARQSAELIGLYNESHSSKEKIKLDVAGDNTIKPASGGKSTNDLGGIDLTAANMNLQTFNGGASIHFNLDPAQLAQLHNAPGFVPVIINIRPLPAGQAGIADLRIFLGLDGRQAVS